MEYNQPLCRAQRTCAATPALPSGPTRRPAYECTRAWLPLLRMAPRGTHMHEQRYTKITRGRRGGTKEAEAHAGRLHTTARDVEVVESKRLVRWLALRSNAASTHNWPIEKLLEIMQSRIQQNFHQEFRRHTRLKKKALHALYSCCRLPCLASTSRA